MIAALPPSTNHTRRSHSTAFSSKDTFSRRSLRVSSSTFGVTSVDLPNFDLTDDHDPHDDDENANAGDDSASEPITTAPLQRSSSFTLNSAESAPHPNSSSGGLDVSDRATKTQKLRLAHRETRQICWLRGITIAILSLAAVLVSLAIYISTSRYQEDQFEAFFDDQAEQMLAHVESNFKILLQGMEQWSYLYQSTVGGDFMTVAPQFDDRITSMLHLTQTSWIGVAPLVENTNVRRRQWERYSQNNVNLWLDEGSISQTIVPPTSNNDYMLPFWQHAPTTPELVNLDALSSSSVLPQELNLSVITDPPTIVLGKMHDIPELFTDDGNETMEALSASMLYFPILGADEDAATSVPTGVVMGNLKWDAFLQVPSTLDQSSAGIVLVLDSFCAGGITTSHAYQVVINDDQTARIVTLKPLDNVPSQNSLLVELEQSLDIIQILVDTATDLLMTSIDVQQNYCSYTLHVFPTEQVQESHMTRHPAAYTGCIAGVFVFCSFVFLVYDCLVERRQRKVMKSAAKTHEIVAGLFPETVRNRLFGESIHSSASGKKKIKFKDEEGASKKASRKEKKAMKKRSAGHTTPPVSRSNTSENEFITPQKPDIIRGQPSFTDRNTTSLSGGLASKPIADLFPNTTVMFADIAGFTAWSSARDPSQVFTLLETIYAAFDKLALRRSVFKVETIGDCYVAVTGLPIPQEDHAIIMIKFARDCLKTMQRLTRSLEVELGPDTGDLCIRVGLNSGPVTAGVLRGQKSRFQLFGDTVNFASRMESNGLPNQIHCSQQTADLLTESSKSHWIHPRKDMVHAKGKGLVQTYWVISSKMTSGSNRSMSAGGIAESIDDDHSDITEEPLDNIGMGDLPPARKERTSDVSPHLQRLIDWNVDTLLKVIKTLVATRQNQVGIDEHNMANTCDFEATRRKKSSITGRSFRISGSSMNTLAAIASHETNSATNSSKSPTLIVNANPREEYTEAIRLPHYDPSRNMRIREDLELDSKVKTQLRDYVTTIACAYNDNPFHNFEHASHVTMSANKILKRVVNADQVRVRRSSLDNLASKLHDFTYGITSDPMTHFACLFSALIHDVDHPGISNAQMLKEKHSLAEVYDGKSIAEQNSFDFAWELLMDADFEDLRGCLFENESELKRFRQLVINSIMATDVFDPDLVKLRNDRWRKAFPNAEKEEAVGTPAESDEPTRPPSVVVVGRSESQKMDLKATVVIEHLIQASDVAHTMQHWHVYQKWNRRLFEEMYAAFRAGRSPNDPAKSWYDGELWFYDNYIIPLAKKLRECRVFGASSDEFLTYAMDNRSEWETKGRGIVEDMVASCTNQSEEFTLIQMSQNGGDFSMEAY